MVDILVYILHISWLLPARIAPGMFFDSIIYGRPRKYYGPLATGGRSGGKGGGVGGGWNWWLSSRCHLFLVLSRSHDCDKSSFDYGRSNRGMAYYLASKIDLPNFQFLNGKISDVEIMGWRLGEPENINSSTNWRFRKISFFGTGRWDIRWMSPPGGIGRAYYCTVVQTKFVLRFVLLTCRSFTILSGFRLKHKVCRYSTAILGYKFRQIYGFIRNGCGRGWTF